MRAFSAIFLAATASTFICSAIVLWVPYHKGDLLIWTGLAFPLLWSALAFYAYWPDDRRRPIVSLGGLCCITAAAVYFS